MRRRLSVDDRFWRHVEKADGCWLWQASTTRHPTHPYGHFFTDRRGKMAHRVAWELTRGPIPEGMQVCHRCDVTLCVNPDHLFLGTHQQNMDDKMRKGRHRIDATNIRGSGAVHAKLTEAQIPTIRRLYAEGYTQQAIATHFGVSVGAVHLIVRGLSWTHVPGAPDPTKGKPATRNRRSGGIIHAG